MTLDTQLITMLSMIIGGIYLGFATETFRRISQIWKDSSFLKYIFEIGYWVLQTCILFFVLYQVNDGELRVYIFLAILLGFSIYKVVFQAIYRQLLEWIIRVIKAVVKGILKIGDTLIIRPIVWIVQTLYQIVIYVGNLCYRIILFILRLLLYPVYVLLSFVKKLLPEKFLNKITQTIRFCSTIINKFKKWIKRIIGRRR